MKVKDIKVDTVRWPELRANENEELRFIGQKGHIKYYRVIGKPMYLVRWKTVYTNGKRGLCNCAAIKYLRKEDRT